MTKLMKVAYAQSLQKEFETNHSDRFILDSRGVLCNLNPQEEVELVHKDFRKMGFDDAIQVAFLISQGDCTHDHFFKQCDVAGYSMRGFFEETEAIAWLKAPPQAMIQGQQGRKVMILDDNPGDKMLMEIALQELDPKVQIFPFLNPTEAMGFYQKEWKSLDVVLVDRYMPGMNGIEWIEQARRLDQGKALIYLLSGHLSPIDKITAKEAGATDWLIKGSSFPELLTLLERLPIFAS